MNRPALSIVVGVLCLLPCALTDPRPDFGVQPKIPASDSVNTSFVDAFGQLNDVLDPPINTTLQIDNAKLKVVYKAIQEVQGRFKTFSSALKYEELFTTDNGTTLAFANVISPLTAMFNYLLITFATTVTTPLDEIGFFGIVDELADEFVRFGGGLPLLASQLQGLKESLAKAVLDNGNSTVMTVEFLGKYVKSAAVYKVARAIRNLEAYTPVITYTLDTVYENLLEADRFIDELQAEVNNFANSNGSEYTDAYKLSSDAVELKASSGVAVNLNVSSNLNTALSGNAKFTATSNASTILGKLDALAKKDTSVGDGLLQTEFNATLAAIKSLVGSKTANVNVTTDPTVQALIDVLMGNNKGFGRYCYHKYKDLFSNLFDNGVNSGFECVDKETERLVNLQDIIVELLVQINYDLEGISEQISLCTALSPAPLIDSCVAAISSYYVDLFVAMEQKINTLYTFVTREAIASRSRLLICFELSYYQVAAVDATMITNNVQACARDGPSGTEE
ncbi:uncharacterized protein LOC126576334 [Anopheles aquasalis]|uniref:uncharacterized protein LOC126576334 n=1 Tax=Anopheles aquasalis TaxID=42839 RepID=UPI00215AF84F|nr:uncharacterized protein LOC126576334 [Anopheles aquasalis]